MNPIPSISFSQTWCSWSEEASTSQYKFCTKPGTQHKGLETAYSWHASFYLAVLGVFPNCNSGGNLDPRFLSRVLCWSVLKGCWMNVVMFRQLRKPDVLSNVPSWLMFPGYLLQPLPFLPQLLWDYFNTWFHRKTTEISYFFLFFHNFL